MKVGTVKEILDQEYRVGLTPRTTKAYIDNGQTVYVEKNAGLMAGYKDSEYEKAGAIILDSAKEVWDTVDLMVKVKEPLESEYHLFKENQILFGFLHLSSHKGLVEALLAKNVTGLAYETIQLDDGRLPCLEPMSAIAGRVAVLQGAKYLQSNQDGMGKLMSGTDGVDPATVVIIGAGNAGLGALEVATGLKAFVYLIDINEDRLKELKELYGDAVTTMLGTEENIKHALTLADVVISTVAIPGAKTPKIIKRSYYKDMKRGAVIIDIAIDQGGSTEVAKVMSLTEPTFVVDGIIHYCVPNMPSTVHQTATIALNNAVLPYGIELANNGIGNAKGLSTPLKRGINTWKGKVTNENVAKAHKMDYFSLVD